MHYRNGRVAKIGDAVIGTVFNNGGAIVAGTLVSVTPGPDCCSAMVGFVSTVAIDENTFKQGYVMINDKAVYLTSLIKVQGTEKHGSDGPIAVTFYTQDYTECKNLLHAEDANKESAQPEQEPEPDH